MKKLLMTLLAAALVVSCQKALPDLSHIGEDPDPQEKEEPVDDENPPISPTGYFELLNTVKIGLIINEIRFSDKTTLLIFNDNSELELSTATMPVDDCTSKNPSAVSLDTDGKWLVGGKPTGMKNFPELTNEEASPVYLYFWGNALIFHLNNGKLLKLDYSYVEHPYRNISGRLPIVYLKTDNSAAIWSREVYIPGSFRMENPDHMFSDVDTFTVRMQIRGRGNSTWDMPKRPYRVKFDEKTEILGIHKDKDWCLLANYSDKSLIRTHVAMELSRICGMDWNPELHSVEVYLNTNYLGVYSICQHKEVSKEKVNINTDAGDVYLEVDARYGDPVNFNTLKWSIPICFKDPEYPTDEVKQRVINYINNFETDLKVDKSTALDYIDIDSFVNYFIINELAKNVDANFYLSTFFILPKDGKLKIPHVWDFDLGFGNCNYLPDNTATGWYIKTGSGYFRHLFANKTFVKRVKERWAELYPQFCKMDSFIDQQVDMLSSAQVRNFTKWKILGSYVWPNYVTPATYQGEIDYLKEFYFTRLEWLNTNISKL